MFYFRLFYFIGHCSTKKRHMFNEKVTYVKRKVNRVRRNKLADKGT